MLSKWLSQFAVILIKTYQVTLSPLLGPRCRYYPSCSQYGIACFKEHGFVKGMELTVKRIVRCHPFAKGGVDMPPKRCEHG